MTAWHQQGDAWSAPGTRTRALFAAIGTLVLAVPALSAQQADFDIDVARVGGGRFEPFVVETLELLSEALSAGKVESDTRLLVSQHPAGRVALLLDQLTYHHVAQGSIAGEPWMVSF